MRHAKIILAGLALCCITLYVLGSLSVSAQTELSVADEAYQLKYGWKVGDTHVSSYYIKGSVISPREQRDVRIHYVDTLNVIDFTPETGLYTTT